LRELFAEFGNIIDIVAKKNLKAKGQAFIVYDNVASAQNAIDELQGFELFGKQMHLDFAKTRSDATVKREDGDAALEQHKKLREAEKGMSSPPHIPTYPPCPVNLPHTERKKAEEEATKAKTKRAADAALAERPSKAAKPHATGIVPEEYLPPNKILLLRDAPEDYTRDMLSMVFGRFPGFKEVRMVPSRKGLGFVEYEDEAGAIQAKEMMHGKKLGNSEIKVTFQRKD
jgi:U2 small nuclear ribonucleoprotein B''